MPRTIPQEDELSTPAETFEGFFEATHQRLFTALCLITGERYEAERTKIAYIGSTDEDDNGMFVYGIAIGETRFVSAGTIEELDRQRSHPRELIDSGGRPVPEGPGSPAGATI